MLLVEFSTVLQSVKKFLCFKLIYKDVRSYYHHSSNCSLHKNVQYNGLEISVQFIDGAKKLAYAIKCAISISYH